ncbi:MAG: insulinase family protein [Gemmatimonadetes bacterium]|nr:insulinase family protein [Gemmatimonadota bacterium]
MRVLRPLAVVASAAAVLSLWSPIAEAQGPTRPPAPMPLTPAQFPPFAEATLPNGLRLLVVPSTKQPVLSVTLALPAGNTYDPTGRSGLAELMAGLLTKGAGTRSADEISAAIEGVGGSIGASAGADFLTVSSTVLVNDRELAFDLLADVVLRPTFPATEVDLLRKQTLSGLALQKSQPGAIASRAFARGLYGEHPYGRSADEGSVGAITREEIVAFHAQRMRPAGALLVVAGAIDAAEARRLAERAFGGWTGTAPAAAAARAIPQRTRTEILLVHRPGSVQANIVAGNTTWLPSDTRGYALALANEVLGGGSDSRLFDILREQKGWTYGAYSSVSRRRGIGSFSATAEVRNAVADSALRELLVQMRRMGAEPMTEVEFDRKKQTLVGRFPLQVETADAVASQVANARLLGLPTDYVQTYRQRLAAVTAVQAQAAARAAIRADATYIVVVGDATALRETLAPIAPLTIVDVDGRPVDVAALTVRAGGPAIDASKLVPASDSFAVLVQGQVFGYQASTLTRSDDGWTYTERSQLATIIQQTTTATFGADLTMRRVEQSGRLQGQEMGVRITYAGGKASGEGQVPGAQGMEPVRFADVAVPAGVVDENIASVLLPYLAWAPDARHTINVLTSKGAVQPRTYAVTGEEAVTIAGAPVPAFKVSVSGGEAPVVMWIEKVASHRVLKIGPVGQPIEFVRVR